MYKRAILKNEKEIIHLFFKTFLLLLILVILPIMAISVYFDYAASNYWRNDILIYQQKSFLNYSNSIDNKISQVLDIATLLSETVEEDDKAITKHLLTSITDTIEQITKIEIYPYGVFTTSISDPIFHNSPHTKLYRTGQSLTLYKPVITKSNEHIFDIVFYLDEEKIIKPSSKTPQMELSVFDLDGGCIYASGNILYQFDKSFRKKLFNNNGSFEYNYEGKHYQILNYQSPITGWVYIGSAEVPTLLTSYSHLSKVLFSAAIICVFLAIIISFIVAIKLSEPTSRLLSYVSGGKNKKLSGAYKTIQEAFNEKQKALEELKPVQEIAFFRSLLKGKKVREEDINANLEFIGRFKKAGYLLALLKIKDSNRFLKESSPEEQLLYEVEIEEFINNLAALKTLPTLFIKTGDAEVTIVINVKEDDQNLLKNIEDNINTFTEMITPSFFFSFSSYYNTINELSIAYKEVQEEVQIQEYMQSRTEIEKTIAPKLKALITHAIKTTSQKEIEEALILLQNEAKDENSLLSLAKQCADTITEIMILNNIPLSTSFSLPANSNREEVFDSVRFYASEAIKSIQETHQSKMSSIITSITDYISTNLGRDISLNDVADHVSLSASYASKIIKENLGCGFVEYISKLRVERSKKLLECTDITVEKIGFQLGFNTLRSFIRTFKTYTGMTPSQYRNKSLSKSCFKDLGSS